MSFAKDLRAYLFGICLTIQLLSSQIYEVDTIFITATRYREAEKWVIQPNIALSSEEIKNRTIGDITHALNYETGLDIRSYSYLKGLSSISIQGSLSSQVLSLFSGMPLNSPSTGVADLSLIPNFFISKAEIVKGPSSGIYGANALAGVVNLLPSVKDFKPSLSFRYGSNQTFHQEMKGSFTSGKFSFGGGLENFSTRGIRKNDDVRSLATGICLDYDNSLKLFSGITFRNMGVPGPIPAKDSLPKGGDSLTTSLFDRQRDTFYFANLTLDKEFGKTALLLNGFFNKSFVNFYNLIFFDTVPYEYKSSYHQGSFGINLSLAHSPWEEGKISFGGDMKKEFARVFADTNWSAERFPFGIFSTFRQAIPFTNRNLICEITFRYDKTEKDYLSPAAGIVAVPFPNHSFKFYYGRGFRIPTFNDLYFPYSGNPNLKSEFGMGWEFGYRWEGKGIAPELNLFYRKAKNLIRWAPVPDTLWLWRPQNLDTTITKGLEMKVKIKSIKRLLITIGQTFTKGSEIKSGKYYPLPVVPNISFTTELSFRLDENTLFYLGGIYKGERRFFYDEKEKVLPAYTLLNLSLRRRLMPFLTIEGRVENLLDSQYDLNFGTTLIDRNYPGGKRKFFIGLEASQ